MKTKEYKQRSQIYFQTQGLSLLCGLHAINNFLSRQQYTKKSMNQICYTLSNEFINPHKHFLFGGDYDVNVLIYSLDRLKYDVEWHDKRKAIQQVSLNECEGFLINIEYPKRCYHHIFCTSNRHWVSVKVRQNDYLIAIIIQQKYYPNKTLQEKINFFYYQSQYCSILQSMQLLYMDSSQQNPKILNKDQLLKKLNEIRKQQNGEILKINYKKNTKQQDDTFSK